MERLGLGHRRHSSQLATDWSVHTRYSDVDLHLVLDNYRTHKHPVVRDWLEHHPRFHLHFTPTSASWMNQVETWFSIVHRKAVRRGVFRSVAHLKDAINRFLDAWNLNKHPFTWVQSAEEILRHAKPKAISGPAHSGSALTGC